MVSLQSFEQIDFVLAAALLGVAALMLIWNIVNVVRLSKLGRKIDRLESELEKKVLEMEKLRKERQEAPPVRIQEQAAPAQEQNQGIEVVSSGVAMAPGVAEAVAQDIPSDSSPIENPGQMQMDAVPAPEPSGDLQIEIVQSDHYANPDVMQPVAETPMAPEPVQAPDPVTAPHDFGVVMEPVEFDIDLGSRNVKEAQTNETIKIAEPEVLFGPVPLPFESSVVEETPTAAQQPEPGKVAEPSLEETMIDQFEKTSSHEVSIRMYNPQKRNADFKAVRDALKKAAEDKMSMVRIDLSDVFFIYPQEVAELTRQLAEMKKNGAQIQFAGVSTELADILRGQGLDTNPA